MQKHTKKYIYTISALAATLAIGFFSYKDSLLFQSNISYTSKAQPIDHYQQPTRLYTKTVMIDGQKTSVRVHNVVGDNVNVRFEGLKVSDFQQGIGRTIFQNTANLIKRNPAILTDDLNVELVPKTYHETIDGKIVVHFDQTYKGYPIQGHGADVVVSIYNELLSVSTNIAHDVEADLSVERKLVEGQNSIKKYVNFNESVDHIDFQNPVIIRTNGSIYELGLPSIVTQNNKFGRRYVVWGLRMMNLLLDTPGYAYNRDFVVIGPVKSDGENSRVSAINNLQISHKVSGQKAYTNPYGIFTGFEDFSISLANKDFSIKNSEGRVYEYDYPSFKDINDRDLNLADTTFNHDDIGVFYSSEKTTSLIKNSAYLHPKVDRELSIITNSPKANSIGKCSGFYDNQSHEIHISSGKCHYSKIASHEMAHALLGHVMPNPKQKNSFQYILNESVANFFSDIATGLVTESSFPEAYADSVEQKISSLGQLFISLHDKMGTYATELIVNTIQYQSKDPESFLINMLIADDNNNSFTDGSPHEYEILSTFADYDIGPGAMKKLSINELGADLSETGGLFNEAFDYIKKVSNEKRKEINRFLSN